MTKSRKGVNFLFEVNIKTYIIILKNFYKNKSQKLKKTLDFKYEIRYNMDKSGEK